MSARLGRRVRDDPDVLLPPQNGHLQHVRQGDQRRFGAPPRPDQIDPRPAPLLKRVQMLRQPNVQRRRRLGEMIRKIFLGPIQEPERPIDTCLTRYVRCHITIAQTIGRARNRARAHLIDTEKGWQKEGPQAPAAPILVTETGVAEVASFGRCHPDVPPPTERYHNRWYNYKTLAKNSSSGRHADGLA